MTPPMPPPLPRRRRLRASAAAAAAFAAWAAVPAASLSVGRGTTELLSAPPGEALGDFRTAQAEVLVPAWKTSARVSAPSGALGALLARAAAGRRVLFSVENADPEIVRAEAAEDDDGGRGDGSGAPSAGPSGRVRFECLRAGSARLTATFATESSEGAGAAGEARLSLVKSCTAEPNTGLVVGTSAEDIDDVVKEGASRWSAGTAAQRVLPDAKRVLRLFWAMRMPDVRALQSPDDVTYREAFQPARASVTVLDSPSGAAAGGPEDDRSRLRRWRRRLRAVAMARAAWERDGVWRTVPLDKAHSGGGGDMVRVRFSGSLATGGALEASASSDWTPAVLDVQLECLRAGTALVEVELIPKAVYQPYRPTVISFVKECGRAVGNGFDVAMRPMAALRPGIPQHPDLVRDGASIGHMPAVGGGDMSVALYWRSVYGPPDASSLVCDADIVEAKLAPVEVHGAPTWDGETFGRQDVSFQCSGAGAASCKLRFGWRLFTGPEVRFRKVCGGRAAAGIDVGSSLKGAPVVLVGGKVTPSWGGHPTAVLPSVEASASFALYRQRAARPGEAALKVGPPTVVALRPGLVRARAAGALAGGGVVGSSSEAAELEVHTECVGDGIGASDVEVTLPVLGRDRHGDAYEPLKFAFVKMCGLEPAMIERPMLEGIFVLLFVICCVLPSLVALTRRNQEIWKGGDTSSGYAHSGAGFDDRSSMS